jgi:predicted transcriptional regulator
MAQTNARLRELVAEVASAYFAQAQVSPGEIRAVIREIATSLEVLDGAPAANDGADRLATEALLGTTTRRRA